MDQRSKAESFRRMHRERPILVLPNAWDVASAKALAAIDGCRALATSSAAVARSLGWEDGERAPAAEMIEVARRMAAAVDLPVTVDLERGYGDPVGAARAAWDAGLVGINIEDSSRVGLVSVEAQLEVLRAIRAAVPELVVNARVDVFVRRSGDIEGARRVEPVDDAVERANAYLAAGADCAYPILCPADAIAALVRRIHGPVNVLAHGAPAPAELEQLGVARMTWGSGLASAAYAEAVRVAREALT